MSRYIPEEDGKRDPKTFASVMETSNAKYLLAKVINNSISIILDNEQTE